MNPILRNPQSQKSQIQTPSSKAACIDNQIDKIKILIMVPPSTTQGQFGRITLLAQESMCIRLLPFLLLFSAAVAAENKTRIVDVSDWTITIPSDFEVKKKDGPDFYVMYFVPKEPDFEFCIYVGSHP